MFLVDQTLNFIFSVNAPESPDKYTPPKLDSRPEPRLTAPTEPVVAAPVEPEVDHRLSLIPEESTPPTPPPRDPTPAPPTPVPTPPPTPPSERLRRKEMEEKIRKMEEMQADIFAHVEGLGKLSI